MNTKPNRIPNNGRGRPKGARNKVTGILKDAILKAAEEAGGHEGLVGYLKEQAEKNPGPFMTLLGKVLPMQVIGDLTHHRAEDLSDEDLMEIARR